MFVWLLKCVYSSYIIGRPSGRTSPHSHTCSMINSVLLQTHSTLCVAALFCSRKAKLFLATFYWCNAVPIILFRLLIIYTNTSHFLLPFVWLFVGIAFVHNFRQSTSHLCPFVIIQSINIYLNALNRCVRVFLQAIIVMVS